MLIQYLGSHLLGLVSGVVLMLVVAALIHAGRTQQEECKQVRETSKDGRI